jgi:hypothetical protein
LPCEDFLDGDGLELVALAFVCTENLSSGVVVMKSAEDGA